MKHLFITSLQQPIESWKIAFPEMMVAGSDQSLKVSENGVVWVHVLHEQNVAWKALVQTVLSRSPHAKVIVLSNSPEEAEAMQALALGAVGYLHAYAHPKVLKEVSSVVAHGGVWLGRDLLKHLIAITTQPVHQSALQQEEILEALTKREREVALEAAKGLSNKEIARVLSISERTVKAHLTSVFETLNVKDRLHLALVLQGKASENSFFSVSSLQKKGVNKMPLNS
ncbi:LuxR family transcriptional regulator [Methylophilus aquaticus]|uniref:Response regulator transcription factor n=1 Tax=Methylophilus aquaticus TaxID=1971610 RepID=A0ABT9JSU8_9PROT|nr:response regulator transcription factor [Methylophilus aquaticus]MDP8567190.1 response regulator transcription factor [Methylophilus aquaticus]